MPRPEIPLDLRQRNQEAFRVSDLELAHIKQVIEYMARHKLTAYTRADYYKEHVMAAIEADHQYMASVLAAEAAPPATLSPAPKTTNEFAAQAAKSRKRSKPQKVKPNKKTSTRRKAA